MNVSSHHQSVLWLCQFFLLSTFESKPSAPALSFSHSLLKSSLKTKTQPRRASQLFKPAKLVSCVLILHHACTSTHSCFLLLPAPPCPSVSFIKIITIHLIQTYFLVSVQNGSIHQKDAVNDDDFEPWGPLIIVF